MKSKPTTYILIISVIGVWGIIFYRIFMTATSDAGNINLSKNVQKAASLEQFELKDTFKLGLNYRDPFLAEYESSKNKKYKVAKNIVFKTDFKTNMEKEALYDTVNWDNIKYTGYVVNPSTKKVVSIVRVNNKEKMMANGDLSEGVKLIKNFKNSIKVSYRGETKFINLQ